MEEIRRTGRGSSHARWLVNIIYAAPLLAGAYLLREIPAWAALIVAPVLVASWCQDWLSARAVTPQKSGKLLGFDILAAANYVCIIAAWEQPAPANGFVSTSLLVHWSGIFIIYIAWNASLVGTVDDVTRRQLIKFSLLETPLAAMGLTLAFAQAAAWQQAGWVQPTGVLLLGFMHLALLASWRSNRPIGKPANAARPNST